MKLRSFLLAAPVVLQLVAADPRPTPGPNQHQVRRALERWNFDRALLGPDASSTAAGGASQSEAEPSPSPSPSSTSSPTPTSTSTPPPAQSTTSKAEESTPPPAASSTQNVNSSTPPATSSTPAQNSNTPAQPSTTQTTQQQQVMTTPPPSSTQLVTTNDQGHAITSFVIITQSPVAASPSSTDVPKKEGVSQGTIIGLAVTGSIAGLIVILLIVWKLTGKRFSDLEDGDDNAIKWPELNKDSAAMTPIPARPTGRSGVETNALDDFDTRSAAHSTANLTAADTHYQPYSDDPGYGARPQYYDPYGGVPGSARPYASPPGSHDGDHKNWGVPAEGAQYYDAPMRGASPGPNMAYGDALPRGTSPGPNMAYGDSLGRGTSPGPNMAYVDPMGRTASPAPVGYGGGYYDQSQMSGRLSPGPNLAYGGSQDHGMADPYGRRSPAPGMGGYGARAASPGPNVGYDQGGYR